MHRRSASAKGCHPLPTAAAQHDEDVISGDHAARRGFFYARTLYDNSKAEKELGIKFLPFEQTVTDGAAALKQLGVAVRV